MSGSSSLKGWGRRLCRALWLLAPISSALAGAVTLLYALTPLVAYEGWVLSGSVGLLGSELRAFGEPLRAPPLESAPRISSFLLALGVLSLALAAFSLGLRALGNARTSLEVAAISAVASALALTLLYSLLRVLANDVLPLLEAVRSVYTTAGRLYLDPPTVERSRLLEAYVHYGRLLVAWGAASALLATILFYYRLRVEQPADLTSHCGPAGGIDDD